MNWLKNSSLVKFLFALVLICAVFGLTLYCTKTYFVGVFEDNDNYYLAMSQVLGGLLGGTFTLLGVWWTLIIQKKERKEDLIQSEKRQLEQNRLQNIPVFQYNTDNEYKSVSGSVYRINCTSEDEVIEIPLNIYVKNIGLGAAQHVYYQLFIDNKSQGFKQGKENSLVQVNETTEYTYYIDVGKEVESLSAKLIVYYDDLIGNHYVQELIGSLTKSYTIYSDTDEKEENFSLSFLNPKDYLVVDRDYAYEIPSETIDIYEANKKRQERMEKYTKLENYSEITSLVQKFVMDNQKNIFDYLPECYKKIKLLGSGGGIIDIEETIKGIEYIITLLVGTTQKYNCELNYNVLLKINLNSNKVYIKDIKLIDNTIKSNFFIRFLAKIQFKIYMNTQKKKINNK